MLDFRMIELELTRSNETSPKRHQPIESVTEYSGGWSGSSDKPSEVLLATYNNTATHRSGYRCTSLPQSAVGNVNQVPIRASICAQSGFICV